MKMQIIAVLHKPLQELYLLEADMKTMHITIFINAPKKKVWDTMLEPDTFREWTEVFAPGSYYEGSWSKGSKIKFLAPGIEGMISKIAENRKYEFISIKHLGFIKNGSKDTESTEVRKWVPAYENYTFTEDNGITLLKIDLDNITEEFENMFEDLWPKALDKLKGICEKRVKTKAN